MLYDRKIQLLSHAMDNFVASLTHRTFIRLVTGDKFALVF